MRKGTISLLAGIVACAMAAPAALAAEGDWLFRVGGSEIMPKDNNLTLITGDELQVDDDCRLTFDITYMFRDHWGVELLASDQWNHGFTASGGDLGPIGGEVKHIPPTLSLQYHFFPDSRFRPYVGAGLNYTIFSGEKISIPALGLYSSSTLELDDSWGWAAQVGIDIDIWKNWFINGVVRYIDIGADAQLNIPEISPDGDHFMLGTINIDPWIYGIHVGYKWGRPEPVAQVAPPPPPPPAPAPPPPPPPPADGDGDGVPDSADLCPNTPAGRPVDSNGCRCDYTLSLEFGFDSAELTAADKRALNELIGTLNRLPYVRAVVEGHTDSRGAAEYNQRLSERRAQAVVDYLHAAGIGDNQLTAIGYGESRPVASNETDEGRAANRRAVLRRTDCN